MYESRDSFNRFEQYTGFDMDTRWANINEIKESSSEIDLNAESFTACGLPLLTDNNSAWVDNKDNHSIIFGATGSKKTRLFVMPTISMMIKAGESFIATDPKGELYKKTAKLAEKCGYKIRVLNLREIGNGEHWNPLFYPYELFQKGETDKATALLNDFVSVISERMIGGKDPFWVESAKAFSIACLLLLMKCEDKNQANVLNFANLCLYDKISYIKRLVEKMDPASVCAINFSGVLSNPEETLRCILTSAFSMVSVFVNQKDLSGVLSESTFNIKDFGNEKTAFYIIVPDEKTTNHFIVTTFIKQAYEQLIEQAQTEKEGELKIRVNFMLDEFCNIPRIPEMPNMISAARSRKIRYFLVVQSAHQLESRYSVDAETIKGNCANWVFLASKELSLLKEICELCGSSSSPFGGSSSLISVSELQRLDKESGEALILHDRCYPTISKMPDIDSYNMFKVSEGSDNHSKNNSSKNDSSKGNYSKNIPAPAFFDIKELCDDCFYGRKKYPYALEETKKSYSEKEKNIMVLQRALEDNRTENDEDLMHVLNKYRKIYKNLFD